MPLLNCGFPAPRAPARAAAALALTLASALPAIAGAGEKFRAPDGCEVFATVQMRGCKLAQHYRCSADPAGDQWSVYMDKEGPFYANVIDSETRWLQSFDLVNGGQEALGEESDPASFTALLQTGRDDYDFETVGADGERRRFSGYDELTGETVDISGVTMERTRFELTASDGDGTILWTRSGQQLVARDWRLFWGDRERLVRPGEEDIDVVDTPMSVAGPGEKGYLDTTPIYDCDMMMTEAELLQGGLLK